MIKLSYQRRVPSFRSFGPPGLRDEAVVFITVSLGFGGLGGELILYCFPPPSMEA